VTFCDKLLEKDWIPSKYMPMFFTSSNLMMMMMMMMLPYSDVAVAKNV
jgi:hypothetical protein